MYLIKKIKGFTLIELMITVLIMSILIMIAIPSYQAYIQRAESTKVQHEILKIADQLERYRSKNFSYHGFDLKYIYQPTASGHQMNWPIDQPKYLIQVSDITNLKNIQYLNEEHAVGRIWGMYAIPLNVKYEAFLITSNGLRCKRKYFVENDLKEIKEFRGCGVNEQYW